MSDAAKRGWLWAAIGGLVASVRLFESGLSIDPAIYATVARNLSRTGDLWSLTFTERFFPQFFEHPSLPFWLQGVIFRLFGASDFTARLLGIVCGTLSFYYLYRLGRELVDDAFASLLLVLTILTPPFVGRMATFYLEIPLGLFVLASLFHSVRAVHQGTRGDAVLGGVFLGLAFLTKGLAALPALGTFGLFLLYRDRERFWRSPALVPVVAVATAIVLLFLILQSHYGTFSFWERYVATGLFGKAIRPGMRIMDPLRFAWELFRAHPLHMFFALGAPFAVRREPRLRDAVSLGLIGALLFVVANGMLGKIFYHYFYPSFPFVNLCAAATVSAFVLRGRELPWSRWALRFALVYQVAWNLLPLPHRRKPLVDFLELAPRVQAIREHGVRELEGIDLTELDWIYPAMSLWYWDIGTKPLRAAGAASGPAVLVERGKGASVIVPEALREKGYRLCASSSRFSLWVQGVPLFDACATASLDPRKLR